MPITRPIRSKDAISGRGDSAIRPLVPSLSLAYEHVAGPLAKRGVEVDPSCIWRWVQAHAPELTTLPSESEADEQKLPHGRDLYKGQGEDKYLYRAVDSTGQTIEFLLTAQRDAAGAKRFFRKARSSTGNGLPRVINVDRTPPIRLPWKR